MSADNATFDSRRRAALAENLALLRARAANARGRELQELNNLLRRCARHFDLTPPKRSAS